MYKKINFLLLVITSTICHGMELSKTAASLDMVMSNPKIAWHITEQICINHYRRPKNCKHDIRALYETNNFLHKHYSDEKTMQRIVDKGAHIYYSYQYRTVAKVLGCHTITQKMNHFCDIADNKELQFTATDLQDPWYFSINLSRYNEKSLLYRLIEALQFEKADTVITHSEKIDFGWHVNNYLLKLISESRHKITNEKTREELLHITERLLRDKNMPADGTFLPLTALMYASENDDKPFAQRLLRYGANPHKRRGNYSFEKNALEMEKGEPKGWLKQMVKTNKLFKYWSVKNYTLDGYTFLPQELLYIIFRTIQQLRYHKDKYAYDFCKNPFYDIANKRSRISNQVYEDAVNEYTQKNSTYYTDEDGERYCRFPRKVTINRHDLLKNHAEYNNLFEKAERLLQKGFRPNFRKKNTEQTPLIWAVNNGDEQLAYLLEEYGANPYIEVYDPSTHQMICAFDYVKGK